MSFNKVASVNDRIAVKNVIVSVADKHGLPELARGILSSCPGSTLYSTGGTHQALLDAVGTNAHARIAQISAYTGQPEMQGGLVKTLDWRIYLGLLSESGNSAHDADLKAHGAIAFDMVVSNLYPFATVAAGLEPFEEKRQHIDIGGPCMTRAAAKNFLRVAILSDPRDYPAVLEELAVNSGTLSLSTRFGLSGKSFKRIADYDASIATFMARADMEDLKNCYGRIS